MTIVLSVDNFDAMPDGGPMQFQADRRGFDIGRDSHLDWSLQDPNRHISGKHCEIRFENGQYALYDLSTNGTFLNGSSDRVKSPQILRNGDRLNIGQYVIAVHVVGVEEVSGQDVAPSGNVAQAPGDGNWTPVHQPSAFESDDIWAIDAAAPAPIDRRDLIPPKQRGPREAGYESHFVDLPQTFESPQLIGDPSAGADPYATLPQPVSQPNPSSEFQPSLQPQPSPQPEPPVQSAAAAPDSWAIPTPVPTPAAGQQPVSSPSVFDPGTAATPGEAAGKQAPESRETPGNQEMPGTREIPANPAIPVNPPTPVDKSEAVPARPLVEVSKPPMGFSGMEGESEPFAPRMPQAANPVAAEAAAAGPDLRSDQPSDPVPASGAPAAPSAVSPPAGSQSSPAAMPGHPQAAVAPGGLDDFIPLFARGARINPADLSHLDPAALAEEVGAVMRIVVEHLAVLLAARAKAKMITKSSNRTMLVADGNNPLKFLPTADEILTVMFARSRRGFKDARGSVTEAFADLEKHEFATIFAMQKALGKLLEDVSPEAIESDIAKSVFSSKQAKAWELYVQRWDEKNEPHENGVLDVFLEHFAEFYDQQNSS